MHIPAVVWAFSKVLVIILIAAVVVVTYVPYNTDLTGAWDHGDHHIWLSRTWCGSYTVYDMDSNMDHIGLLSVDRMLNLDKYDVHDPTGIIGDISGRLSYNKCNSTITLVDSDGSVVFTKK